MSDIFLNGGAVMTPPTAGAIFQLVDPAGTIIHEYAAMPVGTVRRIELYSFDTYIFAFSLFYLFINLLFFIHVLDENRSSLSDIVNDEINFHKYKNDAIANYQVIELTPTVVNNIPTYKIVDTYTDPDIFGNVKTMDI
ncbi:MAG: hypothetical protein ACJ71P_16830 [Nitrososphaeraceae archaeon]